MGLGLVQGRFLTSATSIWPSGVAFYFLPIFHQSHHEFGPKCSSFRASSQGPLILASREGGGRQLLHFGSQSRSEKGPKCRFGTRADILDRIFDLGRSRALICSSGNDRPIFKTTSTNLLAKHTSFRQKPHAFNNSTGLRPRGRQLWFAAVDFSLETGPKLTFGTHDRPNTNKQP